MQCMRMSSLLKKLATNICSTFGLDAQWQPGGVLASTCTASCWNVGIPTGVKYHNRNQKADRAPVRSHKPHQPPKSRSASRWTSHTASPSISPNYARSSQANTGTARAAQSSARSRMWSVCSYHDRSGCDPSNAGDPWAPGLYCDCQNAAQWSVRFVALGYRSSSITLGKKNSMIFTVSGLQRWRIGECLITAQPGNAGFVACLKNFQSEAKTVMKRLVCYFRGMWVRVYSNALHQDELKRQCPRLCLSIACFFCTIHSIELHVLTSGLLTQPPCFQTFWKLKSCSALDAGISDDPPRTGSWFRGLWRKLRPFKCPWCLPSHDGASKKYCAPKQATMEEGRNTASCFFRFKTAYRCWLRWIKQAMSGAQYLLSIRCPGQFFMSCHAQSWGDVIEALCDEGVAGCELTRACQGFFVNYTVWCMLVPGTKKLAGLIAVCCWARLFLQPLLALAKLHDIFTLPAPSTVDHIQGIESEGVPSSVQSAALICNASSVLNLERCCFLPLQTADARGR